MPFLLTFLLFWFQAPPTRVAPVTETLHGVTVTDPYRWLEDRNNPEIEAWIEAQSGYARAYLDALPGRTALRSRLQTLIKTERVDTPVERGGRHFFTTRSASQNRPSIYMRRGLKGKDELLVDPAQISAAETTTVSIRGVSDDGALLAYSVRRGGEDETEIRLLDVTTRKLLPDGLPSGRYFGFAITNDNSGLYYSRFTVGAGSRVYYHRMGTAARADGLIFGEGYGPRQNIRVLLSEDGRYLLVEVGEGVPPRNTEIYVRDLAGGGPLRPCGFVV